MRTSHHRDDCPFSPVYQRRAVRFAANPVVSMATAVAAPVDAECICPPLWADWPLHTCKAFSDESEARAAAQLFRKAGYSANVFWKDIYVGGARPRVWVVVVREDIR